MTDDDSEVMIMMMMAMMLKMKMGITILQSLRDVDYVVKDKTLLESIMDTEFFDTTEKGIFYKGQSQVTLKRRRNVLFVICGSK